MGELPIKKKSQAPDKLTKFLNTFLIFFTFLLFGTVLLFAGYYWGIKRDQSKVQEYIGANTLEKTSEPTSKTAEEKPKIPAYTYVSENENYSMTYPPEAQITNYDNGAVSFLIWGPTQKTGTEFYDGFSITIEEKELGDQSLGEIASYKAANAGMTEADAVPLSSVRVAGIDGYAYTVDFYVYVEYIYLPSVEGKYLVITNSTADPTGVGYAQMATDSLNTLKILK